MAQSVERRLGKAEVTGSIPVSSSVEEVRISVKFSLFFMEQKQSVGLAFSINRKLLLCSVTSPRIALAILAK